MSEMQTETQPRSPQTSPFLKRYGPLPMWGWMAVGLAIALAYYFYRQQATAKQDAQVAAASSPTVDSSQIPQFVNQTYVTGTPPSAPSVTPSSPTVPVSPAAPPPPSQAKPLPVTIIPPSWKTLTYSTPNGTQTVADIGRALHLTNPQVALTPVNATAKTFMSTTWVKNHNAKVPKGAYFTYVAGT